MASFQQNLGGGVDPTGDRSNSPWTHPTPRKYFYRVVWLMLFNKVLFHFLGGSANSQALPMTPLPNQHKLVTGRTPSPKMSVPVQFLYFSAHQCTQHSIVVRPTAVRAISTDIICQTIFQHCRTSDLELTATCRIKL